MLTEIRIKICILVFVKYISFYQKKLVHKILEINSIKKVRIEISFGNIFVFHLLTEK